jgi:hypothetical protein
LYVDMKSSTGAMSLADLCSSFFTISVMQILPGYILINFESWPPVWKCLNTSESSRIKLF